MTLKTASKIRLNKVTHSVRASQAVLQYGVGAMVDFPTQTLMTAAPEYWENQIIKIYDERLEKALHVQYFGMPGGKDDKNFRDGISYVRFPEWYFCPQCRKFQPLNLWKEDYQRRPKTMGNNYDPDMVKSLKCPSCRQELVVARIITVCEHGHIDDFPWIKWVHCKNVSGAVKVCPNPVLKFTTSPTASEGLEGLTITCQNCKAKATLKGAFNPRIFKNLDTITNGEYDFTCKGRHPWKNLREDCGIYPKALQRGGSSVYYPVVASSLVIPPYASVLTVRIEQSKAFEDYKKALVEVEGSEALPPDIKNAYIIEKMEIYVHKIALEIGCTEEKQVKDILERKRVFEEQNFDTFSLKYRAEEYDALSGKVSLKINEYDDFLRESVDIKSYDIPYVKQISLVHKIREVQALIGFSRMEPLEPSQIAGGTLKFVSVKEPETKWYPGYNFRGEGIFIEFDGKAIDEWEFNNKALMARVDMLNENYRNSFVGSSRPRNITGKFLLLHTIAHLMIKQLSFECGYSIASLKERLYCGKEQDGKEMAGIFIYTASGDSEGTMGGLVRQGRADIFPKIFKKAIESAVTCSNDPVCSLSSGQGRDSLNIAACYSCTLIPETSCEEFNAFLDRGVVVGTFENHKLGFFSKQIYGDTSWKNI